MIESNRAEIGSHMTVVVGVDLSDVTEHVLAMARGLVRSIDDAQLHIVHVVQPEPLRHLLTGVTGATDARTRAHAEAAHKQLETYCESSVPHWGERVVVHTPVGQPADELTRIARETHADIIVVEVHDHPPRVFHHSVVARIARSAPCSVLAIRKPTRVGQESAIAAASH
jgi:nucleotide-binding universal stress UspA family protein